MNSFDMVTLSFLNQFARRSWTVDSIVAFVADSNLIKGGFVIALVWWAWFQEGERRDRDRERVLLTLCACGIALLVGRLLQLAFPGRLRPLHMPELALTLPYTVHAAFLRDWSSFPSDHAILFFALATGLWRVSRTAGTVLMIHATVIISLPRVYLGYHFSTDVLAGAMIGCLITYIVFQSGPVNKLVQCKLLPWSEQRPALFYPGLFLVTYQFASLFDEVRRLGEFSAQLFVPLLTATWRHTTTLL
jgi:undecaprenyl-diphosphatase